MVGVAVGALPVGIGFGGRGPAQGIALSDTANLGIASLLFLDLCKKQA